MIPLPRRSVSQPVVTTWTDLDEDDGWQDMPVIRSEDNPLGLDDEDQQRYHYRPPTILEPVASTSTAPAPSSNATGAHLEVDADTLITDSWRSKIEQDESDYTRLRLDEDEESEEVHMRTRYLFDEEKAMTPLSQMQATKELLTEGQRIAYVGLCCLIGRRMVKDYGRGWEGWKEKGWKGKARAKGEVPAVESAGVWMLKMMARLYQHMELERDEQRMIDSLAEHGVDPSDLVPALMTTHTVKNPEYDPAAKKQQETEKEHEAAQGEYPDPQSDIEVPPPPYEGKSPVRSTARRTLSPLAVNGDNPDVPTSIMHRTPSFSTPRRSPSSSAVSPSLQRLNPFGDDDEQESESFATPRGGSTSALASTSSIPGVSSPPLRPPPIRLSSFDDDDDDDDGDIGRSASPRPSFSRTSSSGTLPSTPIKFTSSIPPVSTIPASEVERDPEKTPVEATVPLPDDPDAADSVLPEAAALPALPGVSTHLSNTDEEVTLDIRWTVLCDLFLVLIADSVYDARSRVFLERVAEALGFDWLDVVRFENRVTQALEIEEAVDKTEQGGIIEGRRKGALRKRYAMMGAAAAGGALVIGLSAGLMAPVIGAGLGAAFATIGITGTTSFLAGAGGAAVITTGGVLAGANIAGKGMARRTREVRTFEFRPLHNNKRVSCYITVGGFVAGKFDDVRMPFSTLDPIIGDVFSVRWEPEMMQEMGGALRILSREILTQVGQNLLQATVMTGLMSALTWPIVLTKLGYLIDNPWSNALDRARAAGYVLADVILQRHAGVRPVSLIGFSLGARAIFYALVELARAKAFGLVQDVFIFGATVTASKQTWLDVRSAVSGRFVNGYATSDWMLGYLFRMTSGGLQTVAGLRPVDVAPGLENVDVTEIITGHMSYRSCMPQLLALVGFPVTADYFDEPEDPELDMDVQERTIVNEAEETAKQDHKKILGIFPRQMQGSHTSSGSITPNLNDSKKTSLDRDRKASVDDYDEDADELPPREEVDIGIKSPIRNDDKISAEEEEAAIKAIPRTAGFDFQAISRVLGKDVEMEPLRQPQPRYAQAPVLQAAVPERTGSAPAVTVVPPARNDAPRNPTMLRSASYAVPSRDQMEEDEGDIAFSTPQPLNLDDTTWDRPTPSTSSFQPTSSPTLQASTLKLPSFSRWNAWSASSGPNAMALPIPSRSAPPARPHPAELMANPFANGGTDGVANGILGGWGKTKEGQEEEQWATKNPW